MLTLGRTAIEGNIKPAGSRVLLAPKPRPDKVGLIHLPGDNQLNTFKQEWQVLAVGPGSWRQNKKTRQRVFVPLTDLAPGDFVLFKMEHHGHDLGDGTGRVLADAADCELSWREEPKTAAAAFGGDMP